MSDNLIYFTAASGRIDRRRGIIKGCAVVTVGEAKGHDLIADELTLQTVKECAEDYVGGMAVRFAQEDHGGGAANIVGNLRNWRIDALEQMGGTPCLRADLHLLKAHQDYELVMEMAATMPESFGLSIVFKFTKEKTAAGFAARCTDLIGVDIVKNPAANPTGLFSTPVDTKEPSVMKDKELEVQFAQTSAALKDAETKLTEQTAQLAALTTERDGYKAQVESLSADNAKHLDAIQSAANDLNAFKAQVAELTAKLEATEKSVTQRVADEIAKLGVPPVDKSPEPPKAKTEQELWAEYAAIEDPSKRAAFYQANRTIMGVLIRPNP